MSKGIFKLNNTVNKIAVAITVLFILVSKIYPFSPFNFRERSYGVILLSAEHGTGLGGYYSANANDNIQFQFMGQIVDIIGETEMPITDPYSGYTYKVGEKNLLLIPFYAGIKYFPFAGKIANNFNPYSFILLGPDIILDTPEIGGFVWRWKNVNTLVSYGAFIGFGADFNVTARSVVSVSGGYEFFPMGTVVDDKNDYSGLSIKFMLGRQRK